MVGQYTQQLDDLMQRELSRGDFLKYTGVALLGFVGIFGFFKHLHAAVPSGAAARKSSSNGYGKSPYGR